MCEGGEQVAHGSTPTRCAWCTNGICIAAFQACELPSPEEPASRSSVLPTTREGWGRLIGAALGLGSSLYIAFHVLRYLQLI